MVVCWIGWSLEDRKSGHDRGTVDHQRDVDQVRLRKFSFGFDDYEYYPEFIGQDEPILSLVHRLSNSRKCENNQTVPSSSY